MDVKVFYDGPSWRLHQVTPKPGQGIMRHVYRNESNQTSLIVESLHFPVIRIEVAYELTFQFLCGKCWPVDFSKAVLYHDGAITAYKCENCKTKHNFEAPWPQKSRAIDLESFQDLLSLHLESLGMNVFDTIVEARELTDVVGSLRGKIVSANISRRALYV